jgi:hypothetical protein
LALPLHSASAGLQIDDKLSSRLFQGLTVKPKEGRGIDDRSLPLKLAKLGMVEGYSPTVSAALEDFLGQALSLQIFSFVMVELLANFVDERPSAERSRFAEYEMRYNRFSYRRLLNLFEETGLVRTERLLQFEHFDMLWQDGLRRRGSLVDALDFLRHIFGRFPREWTDDYSRSSYPFWVALDNLVRENTPRFENSRRLIQEIRRIRDVL